MGDLVLPSDYISKEAADRITALEAQVAAADRLADDIDRATTQQMCRNAVAAYRAAKGE